MEMEISSLVGRFCCSRSASRDNTILQTTLHLIYIIIESSNKTVGGLEGIKAQLYKVLVKLDEHFSSLLFLIIVFTQAK